MTSFETLLDRITFNEKGLIPVVVQQYDSLEILMLAWMNEESIKRTLDSGEMVYFSRSRNRLWHKGETSKQVQMLKTLTLDCDYDSLLAQVDQTGVACHTGRKSCFFYEIQEGKLVINQEPLVSPDTLYKK